MVAVALGRSAANLIHILVPSGWEVHKLRLEANGPAVIAPAVAVSRPRVSTHLWYAPADGLGCCCCALVHPAVAHMITTATTTFSHRLRVPITPILIRSAGQVKGAPGPTARQGRNDPPQPASSNK